MTKKSCCKGKTTIESQIQLPILQAGQFQLRPDIGVVQINFGDGQYISQTHADDTVCIAFLKANPNRISMFQSYPSNWKDLLNDNIQLDDEENEKR